MLRGEPKQTHRLLEHIHHHLVLADNREYADRDGISSDEISQNHCNDPNNDGKESEDDEESREIMCSALSNVNVLTLHLPEMVEKKQMMM